MKKIIPIILCVIISIALLAGCAGDVAFGVRNETVASADMAPVRLSAAPEAPAMAPPPPASDFDEMFLMEFEEAADDGMWMYSAVEQEVGGGIVPISAPVPDDTMMADKIIHTVFAEIETMSFEETITGVHTLITMYNAFVESSSVSGVNYAAQFHGWSDFRFAHFVIRVPVQHLEVMTGRLDDIGNVIHESSDAVNITAQFFDTQSRLNSLRIQEDRLLVMLAQAEDVPDLILIEERLSDVRFQIESLTTTINTWQSQVDFSTLTLSIREVEQFTEPQVIHRTYWQQIGDGFSSTIRGIGRFFMNLFMWLIVSAPVILIIAVIAAVALLIVRSKIRKHRKKKNSTPQITNTNVQIAEEVKPESNE